MPPTDESRFASSFRSADIKTRIAVCLYLAMWMVVITTLIYVLMRFGHSFLVGLLAASLLFIFVNGSLAYIFRARQLRREGLQPPRYLMYLFFPRGVNHQVTKVTLPKPVRILLGVPIAVSGVFCVAYTAFELAFSNLSRVPDPKGAAALLTIVAVFGVLSLYVGYRLIFMKNDEPLFQRSKEADAS